MVNQITNPPNDNYEFGLDFDYAVWTANTQITLTNVPWNNDYRDVVYFNSTAELNNYIDRQPQLNVNKRSTIAKVSEPIFIDTPFNEASKFNYVRVYNPAVPSAINADTAKYYYYFVTGVTYIAPNTTQITVQLDVWQTYIRQTQFGRCYIERGHAGIANENAFRNYGRDYLTIPEGLDIGSNYMIIDRAIQQMMSEANYAIIVTSTLDLTADAGTTSNPKIVTASGGVAFGMPTGANVYVFATEYDFRTFLYQNRMKPWLLQGIVSAFAVPSMRTLYGPNWLSYTGSKLKIGAYNAPTSRPPMFNRTIGHGPNSFGMFDTKDFRDGKSIRDYLTPRYAHLKKFYTFPYLAIRVSNNAGQQVTIKPEMFTESGEFKFQGSVATGGTRFAITPERYNSQHYKAAEGINYNGVHGDGADYSVSMQNPPTLSIVNDGALLALANSSASRAFTAESAGWSQQKAMRSNEVSYDNATASANASAALAQNSMNADAASTAIGNNLANDMAFMNALTGIGGGAALGAFGGPAGIVAGAAGGAVSGVVGAIGTGRQIEANNAQLANRMASGGAAVDISGNLSNTLRDSNKALSDFAAKGDYENAIAGIQAQMESAQMTPPSMIGQTGGEIFNLVQEMSAFRIEIMMPDYAHIRAVGEYWLRYGYAVGQFSFLPNDLMVMSHFTYWKLKETYIRLANVPEFIKQALRGLMEKGVTVWRNPDDIGFVDPAQNQPLSGFTLDGYEPPVIEPEPIEPPPAAAKRKRKKMLVYSTVDTDPATPGSVWALAGSSPGTSANWIETRDAVRAQAFMNACGVETSVGLDKLEFDDLAAVYRSAVVTEVLP